MSGYRPKTFKEGLSQENNRVALPIINSFLDVYENLPAGLWTGFTAELEGIEAALAKNGSTARAGAAGKIMQANADIALPAAVIDPATIPDDNAAKGDATGANQKGSQILFINRNSTTLNRFVGQELYIAEHPFPYIVTANTEHAASAISGSTVYVVRLELNNALLKNADVGAFVGITKSIFDEPVFGTNNQAKALGLTFADEIPANQYYWLVYRGLVAKDMTGIDPGDFVVKGDTGGAIKKWTIAAGDHNNEVIGRYRGDNLLELDIRGIAA